MLQCIAGKTSFCTELASQLGWTHLNIGSLVAENQCYDGYDEERFCHILDEDKVHNAASICFSWRLHPPCSRHPQRGSCWTSWTTQTGST